MDDEVYVIVYNERDRTAYLREDRNGIVVTTPTVVHATLYDTLDDVESKIKEMREHNQSLGYSSGMFFPLTVSKKKIFLSRLKGNR